MSYSIIDNTPSLRSNKTLTTLFIIANYGSIYKADLLRALKKIDSGITEYYVNRIIENLKKQKYINTIESTYAPRKKIYFICGSGWDRLEKCFDPKSENYIRFRTLQKTTSPRTSKNYRDEQAIIASVSTAMRTDYLPFELPALPGRDDCDRNPTGQYVQYHDPKELEGRSFNIPWHRFKSDNKVSLKNNAVILHLQVVNNTLNTIIVFHLKQDVDSNQLYRNTLKAIKKRIVDFCIQYNIKNYEIETAVTLDLSILERYSNALSDFFEGEEEKDISYIRDRYGEPCEIIRQKKHFRKNNGNCDYILLFFTSNQEYPKSFFTLEEFERILCYYRG